MERLIRRQAQGNCLGRNSRNTSRRSTYRESCPFPFVTRSPPFVDLVAIVTTILNQFLIDNERTVTTSISPVPLRVGSELGSPADFTSSLAASPVAPEPHHRADARATIAPIIQDGSFDLAMRVSYVVIDDQGNHTTILNASTTTLIRRDDYVARRGATTGPIILPMEDESSSDREVSAGATTSTSLTQKNSISGEEVPTGPVISHKKKRNKQKKKKKKKSRSGSATSTLLADHVSGEGSTTSSTILPARDELSPGSEASATTSTLLTKDVPSPENVTLSHAILPAHEELNPGSETSATSTLLADHVSGEGSTTSPTISPARDELSPGSEASATTSTLLTQGVPSVENVTTSLAILPVHEELNPGSEMSTLLADHVSGECSATSPTILPAQYQLNPSSEASATTSMLLTQDVPFPGNVTTSPAILPAQDESNPGFEASTTMGTLLIQDVPYAENVTMNPAILPAQDESNPGSEASTTTGTSLHNPVVQDRATTSPATFQGNAVLEASTTPPQIPATLPVQGQSGSREKSTSVPPISAQEPIAPEHTSNVNNCAYYQGYCNDFTVQKQCIHCDAPGDIIPVKNPYPMYVQDEFGNVYFHWLSHIVIYHQCVYCGIQDSTLVAMLWPGYDGASGSGGERIVQCPTCNGFGHNWRHCPLGFYCFNCGGKSHLQYVCPSPPFCSNCSMEGHKFWKCPHPPSYEYY